MTEPIYHFEDWTGRDLSIDETEDGGVSVRMYRPGALTTTYEMELSQGAVERLQLALAAYLHARREGAR